MSTMQRTSASYALLATVLLFGSAEAQDPRRSRRPLPPVIATEFDPRRDGLPFGNNGDFASPDGNCWGMSLLAIDNYLRRLERGRDGEREVERPFTTEVQERDYFEEMATAAFLQERAERKDGDVDEESRLRDPGPIHDALERIARTGEPEVLSVYDTDGGGHAVVVYGRDAAGNVLMYDPNYPGETLRWPWSPERGFGRHPKHGDPETDMYRKLKGVSAAPYRRHRASNDMRWIRRACTAGEAVCRDRFPKVSSRVTRSRDGERVLVQGKVSGGITRTAAGARVDRPRRVWVVVDGRPVGQADLSADATFTITLPPGSYRPDSRVRVVAATDGGAFAGFGDSTGTPGEARPPGRTPGLAGVIDPGRRR